MSNSVVLVSVIIGCVRLNEVRCESKKVGLITELAIAYHLPLICGGGESSL